MSRKPKPGTIDDTALASEPADAAGTSPSARRRKAAPASAPLPAIAELPDAEPPEKFSSLAREYIGLSVAGGLVVGLLIGAFFPRAAARRLAKRSAALAAVAGEVGVALATQALERAGAAAREGRDKAIDMGEIVGETVAARTAPARAAATRLIGGSEAARETGSGVKARLTGRISGLVDKFHTRS